MYAVILVLYGAVQFIDNLVQFGQIVNSITSGSGGDNQLGDIETQLEELSEQVQDDSAKILAAISDSDQAFFRTTMASMLAHADNAGSALSEWQQTGDPARSEEALNESEAGLSGIVELYNDQAFSGLSMILVLVRILLQRLAVLGVLPNVRTTTDTAQLRAALQFLNADTAAIAAAVEAANQVGVSTTLVALPYRPPVSFLRCGSQILEHGRRQDLQPVRPR